MSLIPWAAGAPWTWPLILGPPPPGIRWRYQASPRCCFPKLLVFGTAPLSPPPTQLPEAKARIRLAPLQMLARVPGSLSEPHIVFEMYPCGRRALAIWAITAFWPPLTLEPLVGCGRQEAQGRAAHCQVRPGERVRVSGPWAGSCLGPDSESVHSPPRQFSNTRPRASVWGWGSIKARGCGPCLPGASIL